MDSDPEHDELRRAIGDDLTDAEVTQYRNLAFELASVELAAERLGVPAALV